MGEESRIIHTVMFKKKEKKNKSLLEKQQFSSHPKNPITMKGTNGILKIEGKKYVYLIHTNKISFENIKKGR